MFVNLGFASADNYFFIPRLESSPKHSRFAAGYSHVIYWKHDDEKYIKITWQIIF